MATYIGNPQHCRVTAKGKEYLTRGVTLRADRTSFGVVSATLTMDLYVEWSTDLMELAYGNDNLRVELTLGDNAYDVEACAKSCCINAMVGEASTAHIEAEILGELRPKKPAPCVISDVEDDTRAMDLE